MLYTIVPAFFVISRRVGRFLLTYVIHSKRKNEALSRKMIREEEASRTILKRVLRSDRLVMSNCFVSGQDSSSLHRCCHRNFLFARAHNRCFGWPSRRSQFYRNSCRTAGISQSPGNSTSLGSIWAMTHVPVRMRRCSVDRDTFNSSLTRAQNAIDAEKGCATTGFDVDVGNKTLEWLLECGIASETIPHRNCTFARIS